MANNTPPLLPCLIGHRIQVWAPVVTLQLAVELGTEWNAQLIDVSGEEFAACVHHIEIMDAIHLGARDAVVQLSPIVGGDGGGGIPERDVRLIDGKILRVQRYILGILQYLEVDLYIAIET